MALSATISISSAAQTEKVTYITPPVFERQIYLYGQPDPADVAYEQWYEIEGRGQFVRNVKVPTLIPYLPEKGKGNGACVIIAPGGAFLHHTFGSGGYEAAEWFRDHGFATFILKYRVEATPREEAEYQAYIQKKMEGYIAGGKSGNYAPATPDYAIEDANAAVRLVRERAAEFGIRPDRIGIVGFSAGALMAVYNAECAPAGDKADFIASIYGQLVLRDMPDKVPPMFAAMSSDDPLSGQSGFEIIQAWQKRGVAELHLYGLGGHNFGMGHMPFTNALWPEQFMAWLKMLGFLQSSSETEPQMKSHLQVAKINGVTDEQGTAIVARVRRPAEPEQLPADWSVFPVGEPNTAYAQYFIGRSFLAPVSTSQVGVFAVTFEPGCRNNWHIHHADKGGGQILIVTAGEGYYQEWGKPAQRIRKGDTVNIPAGVKHWHGAAPDCWFQHLAVEVPGEGGKTEWCEPVDDEAYKAATGMPVK